MKHFYLLITFLFLFFGTSYSNGIRGVIYGIDGEPLPFATIYVEELETGTSTNQEAYYEINLTPGEYTLQFKYVGYESITKKVNIGSSFIQLDVYLEKQTLLLNEVVTTAQSTDPANWMMRKAIAKSSYHRQLVDAYSGTVYVKGKGRATSIPFYFEKLLKNEGIDTSTLIITESVSEVSYKRPNQFSEKVISVYASKKSDFNANPMRFIVGSFYQEEIASSISPLSTKAFQYYNFKHLGAFMDGGHLINEIKVTPKVKAPNVFEGKIQLVEEDWALYSVDLVSQIELGLEIQLKQVYQNINELAWMPISYQFDVQGKLMGVGFEFKYLASVADYKITLNPALPKKIQLVDKDDPETKNEVNDAETSKSVAAIQQSKSNNETAVVNTNDLAKIMKSYQKNEKDSLAKVDVVGVYDYSIDSSAFNKDSLFWSRMRPIPLSTTESRGYAKIDSLNIVSEEKNKEDSVKSAKKSTFEPFDILLGGRYSFGKEKEWRFIIYNALLGTQYNTVEGLNIDYSLGLRKNLKSTLDSTQFMQKDYTLNRTPFLLLKPTFRYAVARKTLTGKVLAKYQFRKGYVSVQGGRYVNQFNDLPAIFPLMNTSFTVMWEQNFMKLYEKDFLRIDYEKDISQQWNIQADIEYEKRYRLLNNSFYSVVDWKREFSPNLPINVDPIQEFDGQNALTSHVKLTYKPKVKYIINNGRMLPINNDFPVLSLSYMKGIRGVAGSDVDFDRVEFQFRNVYEIGKKGTTYLNTKVGTFLNNNALGFMDFAHFPGNRAFITQLDPVQSYRLLDYYLYSTDQYYAQAFLYHQFRKFLVTQIPAVRFMGLKENFFVNYLHTNRSNNYSEVGYSLDGILKFFRVEVVTNYENFRYKSLGFRIGIATTLGGNVSIETNTDE